MKGHYIILVRHGKKDQDSEITDRERGLARQDENGKAIQPEIRGNAAALAEHLTVTDAKAPIHNTKIRYGSYQVVKETADVLRQALECSEQTMREEVELNPERFWKHETKEERTELAKNLKDEVVVKGETETGRNALIVVGHQPQIGWIAEALLGKPIPISHGDIVGIVIEQGKEKGQLDWVISSHDYKAELYDKIKSKMQLTGVIGSITTAYLVFWLESLASPTGQPPSPWVLASTLCFFLGLVFYVLTLYAFDRLLMPKTFWAESAQLSQHMWLVRRPPSSDSWIIYQNMLRVWFRLFTPANVFVGIGLFLLTVAVNLILAAFLVVAVIIVLCWHCSAKPRLGAED